MRPKEGIEHVLVLKQTARKKLRVVAASVEWRCSAGRA